MKWLSSFWTWICHRWWAFVLFLYYAIGRPDWCDSHWERQGMRKALGGRWGRWEINMGSHVMGIFKIWWPSPCEHYPAPPLATSTEPLETEEWMTE